MPVIQSGSKDVPAWCELEDFEIIRMPGEEVRTFPRRCDREIYVVVNGAPVLTCGDYECKSTDGGYFHLPPSRTDDTKIWAWHYDTTIVRMVGHWEALATAGVHIVKTTDEPIKDGRSYDDEKTSDFDRHYHDYQEYWVIYDGEGRLVIGEEFIDTKPGDCIIAPTAWHQDCQFVKGGGNLSLVWLGATPRGEKRIGHLYEPKHGTAAPDQPLP